MNPNTNDFSTRVIDMINDDDNDVECMCDDEYDDAQIMNEFRDALLRIDDIELRNRICDEIARECLYECFDSCDCIKNIDMHDIALSMISTHLIEIDFVRIYNAMIDANNNNEMM